MVMKPVQIGSIPLAIVTKHLHVLREGMFSLCYNWGVEVYVVEEGKGVRQTMKKKFVLENAQNMRLFQVPDPI